MALTATRRIGWDEYLQLPLTYYEIIDGEVNALPTPLFKHQKSVGVFTGDQPIRSEVLGETSITPAMLVG